MNEGESCGGQRREEKKARFALCKKPQNGKEKIKIINSCDKKIL